MQVKSKKLKKTKKKNGFWCEYSGLTRYLIFRIFEEEELDKQMGDQGSIYLTEKEKLYSLNSEFHIQVNLNHSFWIQWIWIIHFKFGELR